MLYFRQQLNSSSWDDDKIVPLKHIRVDAKIRSFAADVKITQIFQNDEPVPIEAVYSFPVEDNAAIYGCVIRIDDEREIVAQIKEKQTARQEYSEALSQGHGAYLLEQNESSTDIFTMKVGSRLLVHRLNPGSRCQVQIDYVSELDLLHCSDTPTIRFVVPTTIAPRYSPAHQRIAPPAETQADYVESVPYGMEFNCQIEKLNQNIAKISSPSHPINVDFSREEIYVVTLNQNSVILDRDILLDMVLSDVRTNTVVALDKSAAMVSFIPTEKDFQRPDNNDTSEFLFIIDCSGSMNEEDKIGLARKAMLLFLKSLPVKCRFNVIRFGSSFSALFDREVTRQYNNETMFEAIALIRNMQADLGGTELLEPFLWLKENEPPAGSLRQIFLLTDGEVSNVTEVINICRGMASYTRIFSFGLGHSPSRALVKGIANATNGHFDFIAPNTRVDTYVAEQLGRALQSTISNIHIKWNTSQPVLHQAPERVASLFSGDRFIFYALLDETVPFDHNTTVELFTGEQQQPIGVARIDHLPTVTNSLTITRLAAKALLRQLSNGDKTTEKSVLTDLSIKYGVLCPFTAFVGVETRLFSEDESIGEVRVREVPIMIRKSAGKPLERFKSLSSRTAASVWATRNDATKISHIMRGNINMVLERGDKLSDLYAQNYALSSQAHFCCASAQIVRPRGFGISSMLQSAVNSFSSMFSRNHDKSSAVNTNAKPTRDHPVLRPSASSLSETAADCQTSANLSSHDGQDLFYRLMEMQQFDGLWVLKTNEVSQLTKKSLSAFSLPTLEKLETSIQQSIITTVIVLIILETRCGSSKKLWQPLWNKAWTRLKELIEEDEAKLQDIMQNIRGQL